MPNRDTDPIEHPRAAAEAVRAFNHTTVRSVGRRTGIAYPGTVYRAIGAFGTLAHRLPQAFDQIGTMLADLHTAGHLTADHGTPTEHANTVSKALREAEQHATAMAEALERAHRAAGPLGYCGPIDHTDDDL
ncbi:hypothetical protein [Streptomyces antibioticus]|uniref:Uncharacterized protein n=1 Tax=Streptomyces antibioticus TaxID=1890 RepID=A0AAE7CLZ6_STRAT|nr:hypothetical protein [Streptomyces antibioticus]OOQ49118.1 hypothetical protein AFM16_22870 [Streptomyces antibioticus]QIT46086.1 hypothetical protein HCX60_23280 [Streptomyces antibioticus]